ncbi:hypothetical protein OnM2_016051 [Erysiphe neolycopersici]|uniref:Uncharacterized protein n=1 Tax=Erysiphe neolycopersici TaxID=212602 RepID=A0A420I508_9PEZI|nr:hypothetical protein OnM2_016051 [Erysiphe neolycopersici]
MFLLFVSVDLKLKVYRGKVETRLTSLDSPEVSSGSELFNMGRGGYDVTDIYGTMPPPPRPLTSTNNGSQRFS